MPDFWLKSGYQVLHEMPKLHLYIGFERVSQYTVQIPTDFKIIWTLRPKMATLLIQRGICFFWGGARDQKEYAFQRTCNIKTNLINHKLVSTILEMSSGQPAHIINSFLKTFYSTLLNILPNSLSIQILLHCC